MKTIPRFKGSWYLLAMVLAIAVCELVAWQITRTYDVRLNPLTIAFVAVGLVQLVAAIIYQDVDIG